MPEDGRVKPANCSLQRSSGTPHHGHVGDRGIRPAWRTGHRPVLTSLRIRKSCRQALNGNRESGPGRRQLTTATSPMRTANT